MNADKKFWRTRAGKSPVLSTDRPLSKNVPRHLTSSRLTGRSGGLLKTELGSGIATDFSHHTSLRANCRLRGSPKPSPGAPLPFLVLLIRPKLPELNVTVGLV
jgi:hypothetical protein